MQYEKPIMRLSELRDSMGFPEELLLKAYRSPEQNFASKVSPEKINSPIIFDTAGFEAWRQKLIQLEVKAMPRRR